MPELPSYTTALDKSWIKCRVCGRVSHNINDVIHRYCRQCHTYHEDREMYKNALKVLGVTTTLFALLLLAVPMAEARLQNERTFCKSAITGHFVSTYYAKRHPKTTICQSR